MPVSNNNYSTVYYSGAGGGITKNGDSWNAVIKEWTASFTVEAYGADTFDNPANSNGVIFKRKEMLGLAEGEVSVTGYAISGTEDINLGDSVNLVLFLAKSTGPNNPPIRSIQVGQCICTKVEWKISADGNSPAEFSATFVPRGAVDI